LAVHRNNFTRKGCKQILKPITSSTLALAVIAAHFNLIHRIIRAIYSDTRHSVISIENLVRKRKHTDEVCKLQGTIKRTIMSSKIANVNISIPHKGPGNIIMQKPVSFDVYSECDFYKAVALLNEDERRIANLPPELCFVFENGKPISQRGNFDGNFHAIEDIAKELHTQGLI